MPTILQLADTFESALVANREGEELCSFIAGHILKDTESAQQVFLLNDEPYQSGIIQFRTLLVVVPHVMAAAYYDDCQNRPTYKHTDYVDSVDGESEPQNTIQHESTSELAEMHLGFDLDMLANYELPSFITPVEFEEELKAIELVLVRPYWFESESINELLNMRSVSADLSHPLDEFQRETFCRIPFNRAATDAKIYNLETGSFTSVN